MGTAEQLQWERKWGVVAAISAFAAAVVPFVAQIWASSLLGSLPSTNSEDLFLTRIHEHAAAYVAAGALVGIGTLAMAPLFVYLYRVVRARRPQIPRIALILAVVAPLLAAGVGVARQAVVAHVADQYAANPPAVRFSPAENNKLKTLQGKAYSDELEKLVSTPARDKLKSGSVTTVAYIGLVSSLLLAIVFVLVSLNAMRAGLLSRFMGILGVIVGALTVIPLLGGPQIIQVFWFVALGILFLNRWPQGRGPAWEAVEQIPWPTAQDRRDAMAGARDGQPARGSVRSRAEPDDEPEAIEETREAARPQTTSAHPRSKKRKRKRRG